MTLRLKTLGKLLNFLFGVFISFGILGFLIRVCCNYRFQLLICFLSILFCFSLGNTIEDQILPRLCLLVF